MLCDHRAVIATKTANVALTDELDAFARSDMAAGGFGNFSEYVRDLLRRRRQQRIEEDLAAIREAMKDAPVGEPPPEMMRELSRLRRSSRQRR
jgi:putative addiction module CopG family antidote